MVAADFQNGDIVSFIVTHHGRGAGSAVPQTDGDFFGPFDDVVVGGDVPLLVHDDTAAGALADGVPQHALRGNLGADFHHRIRIFLIDLLNGQLASGGAFQ